MQCLKDGDVWKSMVRYLTGECDDREKAALLAGIAVDEEKGELLDELQDIWELTGRPAEPVDVPSLWDELDERVQQDRAVRRVSGSGAPPGRRDRYAYPARRRRYRALQAPALVAAVLLLSVLAVRHFSPRVPAASMPLLAKDAKEFATKKGHRAIIRLVDGSVVHLNASSSLRIPNGFDVDARTVELRGEALFDVASDSLRPFHVHTPGAVIEVLGTKFNVRAYAEEAEIKVAVAEGRVAVVGRRDVRSDTLILNTHDIGVVLKGRPLLVREEAPVSAHVAWADGRLTFHNAPFEEVATRLERWYDLEIELMGATPAADGLTASFGDEPLDDVLRSISLALSLEYEIDQEKVTFFASRSDAE